jgi:hypothetical protein
LVAECPVLYTFSPVTCAIDEKASKVVYHATDLFHTFDRMPREFILAREKDLVLRADVVIASSRGVQRHLQSYGRADVELWENVADTSLFGAHWAVERQRRAIFAGNLTASKIDYALLGTILDAGVRVAIAGPYSIDGSSNDGALSRVLNHPNAEYLGLLDAEQLAIEVGKSRVGLIPYLRSEHTAGIFPMKVYEYLAGGLSVVSTPIRSVESSRPRGVTIAERSEFAGAVVAALEGHDARTAAHSASFAAGNSWDERLNQVERLIDSLAGQVMGA